MANPFKIPLPRLTSAADMAGFVKDVRMNIANIVDETYVRDAGRVATGHIRFINNAADTNKVTVALDTISSIYEFDNNSAVTGTNVMVKIGASIASSAYNLQQALLLTQGDFLTAAAHATDTGIVDIAGKETGRALTLTVDAGATANLTSQANTEHLTAGAQRSFKISRTISAEDVTRARVRIATPMTSIDNYFFRIRTSTTNNTEIAYGGAISISSGSVELTASAGTNLVQSNVIDLLAFGLLS